MKYQGTNAVIEYKGYRIAITDSLIRFRYNVYVNHKVVLQYMPTKIIKEFTEDELINLYNDMVQKKED